jgi:SRSO17 transposase
MTPTEMNLLADELELFLADVTDGMGRTERRAAMADYVRGLLLDGERKNFEPIAARLVDDEAMVQGMRQRLQEAVAVADWDEGEVYRRLQVRALGELPGINALVFDDTGIQKKGRHSVGVQRQYSGTCGRIENCQVITTLHLASEFGGVSIGSRLFLPESWANNPARLAKAGVPAGIGHEPKWKLALGLLDRALADGVDRLPVLADAGYGDSNEFRDALVARGLKYIVGVTGTTVVWRPGTRFKSPPEQESGQPGRPRTRWSVVGGKKPVPIRDIAARLKLTFRRVTWREGSRGPQSGYFAAVRIRTAHKHSLGRPPADEQWLLLEKTRRKKKPTTYYLSNLPASTSLRRLVWLAKLRWRIERDYQEMKSHLGLDHYKGRGWRGLHHHLALVAAAHAFLTLRRALSPPIDSSADLSSGPTAGPAANDRTLPALQPYHPSARASDGAVAHVIEQS